MTADWCRFSYSLCGCLGGDGTAGQVPLLR